MSLDPETKQQLLDALASRSAAIQSRLRLPSSPAGYDHPGANGCTAESKPDTAGTVSSRADPGATRPVVADPSTTGTTGAGAVVAETVDMDPDNRADPPRGPQPRYASRHRGSSPSDAALPVGWSGTAGRTRPDRGKGAEPGGHPEDAVGDPETVARAVCLRLLTGAARPRAALAAALRLRGVPDDVAGRVLDRLTEVGLIDDRAYAEAFVAAKHRERALGATALRTELRRNGVDEQTVLQAVQTIDQDAERERARALVSRRVDSAMAHGETAARRRLVGLLARRGYSAELAIGVVNDALAQYGHDEASR